MRFLVLVFLVLGCNPGEYLAYKPMTYPTIDRGTGEEFWVVPVFIYENPTVTTESGRVYRASFSGWVMACNQDTCGIHQRVCDPGFHIVSTDPGSGWLLCEKDPEPESPANIIRFEDRYVLEDELRDPEKR